MRNNITVLPWWSWVIMGVGLAAFVVMVVISVVRNHGVKRSLFASPYALWMIIFTVVPILIIGYYALTDNDFRFTLSNLHDFWDSNYSQNEADEKAYIASLPYALASKQAEVDAAREEVETKKAALEQATGEKKRKAAENQYRTSQAKLERLEAEMRSWEEDGVPGYNPQPRGTLNLDAFALSLWLAFLCTAICLLLGYPAAYFMASRQMKRASSLLILFVVPMWMNITLRTLAMRVLIQDDSAVVSALNWIRGLLGMGPAKLNDTLGAVLLAMIYNFLPFMIFPIYTVLSKLNPALLEASADLGATPTRSFLRVTLPLSVPGVVSGITMVFMPSVTTFAINDILGGSLRDMLGNRIEKVFMANSDWHLGSAISLLMMVLILLSLTILRKADPNNEGGGI